MQGVAWYRWVHLCECQRYECIDMSDSRARPCLTGGGAQIRPHPAVAMALILTVDNDGPEQLAGLQWFSSRWRWAALCTDDIFRVVCWASGVSLSLSFSPTAVIKEQRNRIVVYPLRLWLCDSKNETFNCQANSIKKQDRQDSLVALFRTRRTNQLHDCLSVYLSDCRLSVCLAAVAATNSYDYYCWFNALACRKIGQSIQQKLYNCGPYKTESTK